MLWLLPYFPLAVYIGRKAGGFCQGRNISHRLLGLCPPPHFYIYFISLEEAETRSSTFCGITHSDNAEIMTRTISLHSVAIVTQIVINSCSAYSPRILLSAQHSPLLYITRQQITNPFRFSSVWIVPNCDHRIDDGGEGPCLQSDCTLSVAFESWEFGICAFKLQLKSILVEHI